MDKNNSGSIFIEVIISIGAISAVLLGLVLALIYGVQNNIRAERKALASEIAAVEIEIIRQLPVDDIPYQTGGPLIGNFSDKLAKLPNGEGSLTVIEYSESASIKEITVVISFTENSNVYTETLTTLAFPGGLDE